jgi:hypothetical protein
MPSNPFSIFRPCSVFLLFAVVASLAHGQATQTPFSEIPPTATTITFDTLPQGGAVPNGTAAANVWAPLGVSFDGDDTVGAPPFTIRSSPNILNPGPSTTSAIRATFNPSVSVVGAWGFDFVMEAFDEFGGSLGALTHSDGSAGLFGGGAEFGFLGVTSERPIARVEFRHAFPSNQAFGFHIDDLAYVEAPLPQTELIAFTEFSEPPVGAGTYNPGTTGEELGFATTSTSTGGINPLSGVALLDGNVRVLSHRSINATTTFSEVDISGFENVTVSARIQVANTGYEAEDSLRVYITDGTSTIDLIQAVGATPLNALAGDGFLLYGAHVPSDWARVSLVMASSSNSSQASERYDLDDVEIRGSVAIPEPSSATLVIVAVAFAFGSRTIRRKTAR